MLKMSELLNRNNENLVHKVATFVYLGMKRYVSLPNADHVAL
jgi:hypothetical protein